MVGLSPGRISQLVAQGMPTTHDGRIDPEAARAWMESHLDPSRRRVNGRLAPAVRGLRAEIEAEKLRRLRMENDRRAGRLVDRAQAEAAIFQRARQERDAHLAWVLRTAPVLAAELGVDPSRMFTALDRHMRRHLAELADTPMEELPHE